MKNLLLLTLLKFYDILFIYKRRELFYISVEYKENIIDTGMTLYDANKQIIEKLPSKITNGQLKECKEILKEIYNQASYFMLLCNDIHYYTVLQKVKTNEDIIEFHNLVIELLQDNGAIQDILWANDQHDAVECWIKNEKGTFMFMLFPYDWGVVECH